jgi:hypothetical protein
MALLRRSAETAQIDQFLECAAREPVGLLFEGDAGVGKTSLWLDGVDRARERGFTVLTARASQTKPWNSQPESTPTFLASSV